MKYILSLVFIVMVSLTGWAQHRIEFRIKGVRDSTFYLVNTYENSYLVQDTAKADANGKIVFEGNKPLMKGYYLLVQNNRRLFDFLLNDQSFTIETDTADFIANFKVTGASETQKFAEFLKTVNEKGTKIGKASAAERPQLIAEIEQYKKDFVKKYEGSFAANIVKINTEVPVPPLPAKSTVKDTVRRNEYILKHFFDNVALSDERMVRTPFLGNLFANYLKTLESSFDPDTVIQIADYIIDKTPPRTEIRKYVVGKFAQKFIASDFMGKEGIYTHVAEKYILSDKVLWDSSTIKKNFEYVYRMKPVLIGKILKNMPLTDTLDRPMPLHAIKSKYTLVMIYDPNCHHCQETTKQLVKDYPKLAAAGVKVYMASGVAGDKRKKDEWRKFIRDFKTQPFINVYDSKNLVDFTNEYNTITFPNVFLVDSNFKILANKKLETEQYLRLISVVEKAKTKK
ncbi:DUF4369 domain-containing protein [Flectobacillus major]|uniref:DUF4369 domain-containing protein n=1 Tax=Flectobacillus major TaxID=103 RepID=UPI00041B1A3F|nr:DUF4369 domain-containing protein [Flectobacillus major]